MANEYKSPWAQKPDKGEETPEYLRRPADYVEPKKPEPKRDPEKEKAHWEQTPESIRKPAAIDFNSFGLRDAIDKNVKMMTDEEIAAERAAEREKRAEKIKPAAQQRAESKETPLKESQTESHAADTKTSETSASQQSESESKKYEIFNGQEFRSRMKDYISSDSEMTKGLTPEGRTELEKRLNDPKTAEEMKDKLFLSGEVNGHPMIHPLTSEESARLNALQGAERDQYAAQLLQAQEQALVGQTNTAKEQVQPPSYQQQEREKVDAVSQQSGRKDTDGATTKQQQPSLLLRILLMLLGIDLSVFSSESKQQARPAVAEQQQEADQHQEAEQQQEKKNETVVHRERSATDAGNVTQAAEQHITEVSNLRVEADDGHYKMTAIVDGKETSHEISERDYNKFLALDDSHRLRLFNKTSGIPDGQSVRVADKVIPTGNEQDNGISRSAPAENDMQNQDQHQDMHQHQGLDHTDYASMTTMNFDVTMNEGQQEQRSNGLRV